MAYVILGLTGLGTILAIVGSLWLVVLCFKESALWGIGALLIGIPALVYAFKHWDKAKKPFMIWLVGFVLNIVATVVGGAMAGSMAAPQLMF